MKEKHVKRQFSWRVTEFHRDELEEVISQVLRGKLTGKLEINLSQGGIGSIQFWEKVRVS